MVPAKDPLSFLLLETEALEDPLALLETRYIRTLTAVHVKFLPVIELKICT